VQQADGKDCAKRELGVHSLDDYCHDAVPHGIFGDLVRLLLCGTSAQGAM
jgi:hypothetical protein